MRCLVLIIAAGALGWWAGTRSATPKVTNAPPPIASAPRAGAADYAGEWLTKGDTLEETTTIALRAEGDRVTGVSDRTGARFEMRAESGSLVGDLVEREGPTPIRMEMTPGRDKLVISLLPPASEPDYIVCVRPRRPPEALEGTSPNAAIGPEEAIQAVRATPEVRAWLANFTGDLATRVRMEVVGDDGPVYTIHVYESVPDPPDGGHTATQGWYEVDKQTGRVKPVAL